MPGTVFHPDVLAVAFVYLGIKTNSIWFVYQFMTCHIQSDYTHRDLGIIISSNLD